TVGRMTVNAGVRFDLHEDILNPVTIGPTVLLPTRNLSAPDSTPVNWRDVTPRFGVAYDLFGNGRTALKASMSKYLNTYGRYAQQMTLGQTVGASTTRTWNDDGRSGGIANDFVPQCDLIAPQANGECGALANQSFGTPRISTTFDQDLLNGWGRRGYNWE